MSSKLILSPKSLTNIKIPWNIKDEELRSTLRGAILFAVSCSMYFFIFGKLMGRETLLSKLKTIEFSKLSVWLTVFAGTVFGSAFVY